MGPPGHLGGALTPTRGRRPAQDTPARRRPPGACRRRSEGWHTHEFLPSLLPCLISWKRCGGAGCRSHLRNSVYIISGISRHCKLTETADYVKHVLALWEYSSENTFLETKKEGFIGERRVRLMTTVGHMEPDRCWCVFNPPFLAAACCAGWDL